MTDEVKNDPVTTNDSEESTSNGTGATAPAEEPKEEPKEEAKTEAPVAEPVKEAPAKEEAKDEGAEVEVPAKFKDIVKAIEEMSVLDLNELVKLFEKKFGVSAAAVAVAGPAAAADDAGSSTVTVELTAPGDGKVAVIKVIKEVLGLGLKEAKDLVDAAPSEIKKDVSKEEGEEIKKKLEDAGATATLK